MEQQRILIAESSDILRQALLSGLSGRFQVQTSRDGKEALSLLERFQPDTLVLDLMLPELDGLSLLHLARKMGLCPTVLAISSLNTDYIRGSLEALGVQYLAIKPCSVDALVSRTVELTAGDPKHPPAPEIRAITLRMLSELGIPDTRDGCEQLHYAIPGFARDRNQYITKELYPNVAKLCGKGDGRQVEHTIRDVIHTAWRCRDEAVWQRYFPHRRNPDKAPTNKEFIARLAELLILEQLQPDKSTSVDACFQTIQPVHGHAE